MLHLKKTYKHGHKKPAIVQKWYDEDIVRAREIDREGIPSIIVGKSFYDLSKKDVQSFVGKYDEIYIRPKSVKTQTLRLKDWKSGKVIGHYNRGDLFLR